MRYKEGRRIHRTTRAISKTAAEIIILLILLGVNLMPILWGVITSLKTRRELFLYPPKFFNFRPSMEHYAEIFNSGFLSSVGNSVFYSVMSILLGLLLGVIAAYGFQRCRVPFKKILFYFVIAGIPLSIGSAALLIPNYLYLTMLKLTDKWYTLILLYTAYNLPMAIWILKGGIEAVPIEIEEAAHIDGCSRGYIIFRLIPQLIRPSIASAALFIFIGAWNEFIAAAVMTNKPELRSIQLSIYYYLGFYGQEWGPLTAAATVAILPIIIVFSFLSRMLISGLTQGSVKE